MTAAVANPRFPLPDRTVALPERGFQVSPAGLAQADQLCQLPVDELFGHLVRDQESDAALLVCRRVVGAFLDRPRQATAIAHVPALLEAARAELAATIADLAGAPAELRGLVQRQRAPLALLDGCWLDMVSQPATQPAIIVNRLYAQHFLQRGAGNPLHGQEHRRRRALEASDVALPTIGAHDFLTKAGARPLTALHACWYLALSRLPASFLPEVAGVQYAYRTLGVDALLLDTEALLPAEQLAMLLAEFRELAGETAQARFVRAVRLVIELEGEQVAMLAELARWRAEQTLESQVAEIIARHAPLAGRQHGQVSIGGHLLSETFVDGELDLAGFLEEFRRSRYVTRGVDGASPFTSAMKFGGPMFGIFTESEA